jgi:hypothetical protein
MRIFEVKGALKGPGEYILGAKQTGSHACYLIWGVLGPGEQGRALEPGEGHEELLLALKGALEVSGHFEGLLQEGQALHLKGSERCWLGNPSGTEEALYVIAGGHSQGHGH